MQDRLKAARFRYLNEQLYTSTGSEAQRMFRGDPESFHVYHDGFTTQVKQWPENPLDKIINSLKKMSSSLVIADFGCGDAKLAQSLPNKVYSFDLVALNEYVTSCDMAQVPLNDDSVDVAVFCLSLMGTNLVDYLKEARRVLKCKGKLKVAEVASRFEHISKFTQSVEQLGFRLLHKDLSNNMFLLFDFQKSEEPPRMGKQPSIILAPCKYKKR